MWQSTYQLTHRRPLDYHATEWRLRINLDSYILANRRFNSFQFVLLNDDAYLRGYVYCVLISALKHKTGVAVKQKDRPNSFLLFLGTSINHCKFNNQILITYTVWSNLNEGYWGMNWLIKGLSVPLNHTICKAPILLLKLWYAIIYRIEHTLDHS